MIDWIEREAIYLWYYLDIQIRQIAPYWALGIVLGSAVSVFGKKYIHGAFAQIGQRGGLYDHRPGDKDHQPGSYEDRAGLETVFDLFSVFYGLCVVHRDVRRLNDIVPTESIRALPLLDLILAVFPAGCV